MRLPFNGNYRLTQGFGENPASYARFGLKGHNGLDYGLPTGTQVVAPHGGKVIEATNDPSGYGLYLKIESNKEGSILAHLKSFQVKVGDFVSEGHTVALSNNTGNSTGPHLHWGYYLIPRDRTNGYSGCIDQLPLLSQPIPSQTDTQAIIDELRQARDTNWNLYQSQIKETEKAKERITELEGQVKSCESEKKQFQDATITLNNKIADLNQAMEKDAVNDADVTVKLKDAESELEDVSAQRDALLKALGAKVWTEGLSVIDKLKEPDDQIVSEWQKLYDFVFEELIKKRMPKTKSLIERFIDRIRGVR